MNNIITNTKIEIPKLEFARKVIIELQKELEEQISKGCGPFASAIYDENFNLVAKAYNTVLIDNCSNNHSEINVIKIAEKKLGTNDLSPYNLSLYVTSEPCLMCLGAIMWSGIRSLYYGVPTKSVEKITGFDEGFKPNWLEEFKKRGILVYGNIEPLEGEKQLAFYVENGNKVYKPSR